MRLQDLPTPAPPEPSLLSTSNLEMLVVGLMFLVGSVVVFFLVRPVFRAWARRVELGGRGGVAVEELEQLREQVAEVPQLRERLHELEERLEFTERVLAHQRDQDLLPRKTSGQS